MARALYRCLECRREWYGAPGPTICRRCSSLRVKWLNVGEIRPDLKGLYD